MANSFFEKPILNSPYECPRRHWELDRDGQPTQQIAQTRRRAEFITPIPKPRKRTGAVEQGRLAFNEGVGLSDARQQYDHTTVKGYRREDAKEKKSTMDTYWVPGVNNLKSHGRWAFAEFNYVYEMQDDFAVKISTHFDRMIAAVLT